MIKFRNLKAEEIECRVQQCTEKGLSLLLYKDARCDMGILDETVGAENWQREHYECKGNLFCKVGVCCNDRNLEEIVKSNVCGDGYGAEGRAEAIINAARQGQWVWKADCGAESNTEAEKGEASDSFKRACVNWGIGRELYTAPFIWVNSTECNIYDTGRKDKYNKPIYACKDKFYVEKIKTSEDKKILGVAIKNAKTGNRCFVWTSDAK